MGCETECTLAPGCAPLAFDVSLPATLLTASQSHGNPVSFSDPRVRAQPRLRCPAEVDSSFPFCIQTRLASSWYFVRCNLAKRRAVAALVGGGLGVAIRSMVADVLALSVAGSEAQHFAPASAER
mmetsp:Transcript_6732/g.22103  ORF Transcript_6732/g.22103 Transcript_6732/m.22103 type:complete len:125 (-) Transcript_6732:1518-1892(-)